mgnify:CR=1 FL=1
MTVKIHKSVWALCISILVPIWGLIYAALPLLIKNKTEKKGKLVDFTEQERMHESHAKEITTVSDYKQSISVYPFHLIRASKNKAVKKAVIQYLAKHESKESVLCLTKLSKDSDYEVKTFAVTSLQHIQEKWISCLQKKAINTTKQQCRHAYILCKFLSLNLCSNETRPHYINTLKELVEKIEAKKSLKKANALRRLVVHSYLHELAFENYSPTQLLTEANRLGVHSNKLFILAAKEAFENKAFNDAKSFIKQVSVSAHHPFYTSCNWWLQR